LRRLSELSEPVSATDNQRRHDVGIIAAANVFFVQNMQGRAWVGVDAYSSDTAPESLQPDYFSFVDRIITLNPAIGVFLLNVSLQVRETYRQRYGDRLLCLPTVLTASAAGDDGSADGDEALLAALLVLKCNYFVGSRESHVSAAVASLRSWPRGVMFLLG
jgi:hypothetical protein